MADIARRAGVSAATVSMSLRNKPNIPLATRERIVELARQLGYQTNPFVSALMRSRRRGRPIVGHPVLALVCALDAPGAWRDSPSPTRRLTYEGARERAGVHGYQGQEFWLHQDGMTPGRFSEMLRARGIQGILLGPRPDEALPPDLHWDYFSTVSLSVPIPSLTLPTVCNDHYFSSLHAVQECHLLGYRRPGLILRQSHRELFQGRWEAGFSTAQASLPGIEATAPLYAQRLGESDPFEIVEFKRWLRAERPDVIIMLSPGIEWVEHVLLRLGRRVPRDIGLVGLSCPEMGDRVSGIYQNGRLMGATAVDMLVGMVERHETGLPAQAVTTMIEGVWNPGTTVRPLLVPVAKRRARQIHVGAT